MTVTVRGLAQFRAKLATLEGDIDPDKHLSEIASRIAGGGRVAVPVRSGTLRGTIMAMGTEVKMGGGIRYAGPMEFGGWPPGRPYIARGRYIWPVATRLMRGLHRQLEADLNTEIRKHGL